jgi:hypothetical protein
VQIGEGMQYMEPAQRHMLLHDIKI